MQTSAQRQSIIKAALEAARSPITATAFGRQLGVSRQTIVGDIALMRAQGEPVIATPQGYEYRHPIANQAVIVCRHSPEDTAAEMNLIIQNGGTLLDVIVDHPLYGQLRGELQLRTTADANLFIGRLAAQKGHLLSELTDGVHLHTIAFEDPDALPAIKAALAAAGFLYEG